MLKDDIEKNNQLKSIKKDPSQSRLTRQISDPGHKIEITSQKTN
jgi:hypothetical protein